MFYHFLRISSVKDVRHRAPVPVETRLSWESNTSGNNPTLMKLQFDWLGGTKSAWNVMFLEKLLESLRLSWERWKEEWNLPWHSDEHLRYKILLFYESLAKEWKDGQALPGESAEACMFRLQKHRDKVAKRARENTRRLHVSSLPRHTIDK
jgi:hypothetical protein